ncbi:MAG: CYTH domain-containing protein [Phycisphaeraceae bacterium]|nr:MAG: CYTH domain-containing protein [Phycisphaeraceae bacterium]
MRNVEFKAELRDPQVARAVARSIGGKLVGTIEQTDTYYRVLTGRLKKREAVVDGEAEPVEYIHYERDNRTLPRISSFQILSEAEFRERFGTLPLPEWLTVRKQREVYLVGHARIHLDRVEHLGSFIEFEALVTRDHNVARAHETVAKLRADFGPVMGEALSGSYSDLLAQHAETPDPLAGSGS